MIKNYFKLVFKNLRKQTIFSLINILGLTVGITCCLMIFLYVKHEYSFDDFHQNGKNIYRLARVSEKEGFGTNRHIAWVSGPYAAALRTDYPDAIEKTIRVMPDNDLFTYNNIGFNEKKVYITDSNFFQFFNFPLIKGNAASVLNEPASIVLTASAAKKYFGNEDPMGKIIAMNKDRQLKVTGIAADILSNSHLDFDMVVPVSNFKFLDSIQGFPNNGLYTFVQLNPQADPKQLESHFPQFMNKYLGKYYAENGFKMKLALDPLKEIYFSDTSLDGIDHGSKRIVYIFMSVGLLILIIACINFMNLATARAADRSKEVGLRKVMGAVRKQLIVQFIIESFLYAAVAAVLSLGLLQLLMPVYTNLLGYQLPAFWSDASVYLFIIAAILAIGFLAGVYPALLLSSFSPIESLKGKLRVGKNSVFFRKSLVVFQFSISVLLIIGITVITSQLNYVRHKDLGFTKEQSMLVRMDNTEIYRARTLFKKTLQNDPSVSSVSLMSGEPGGFHDRYGFETEAKPGEKTLFNTEFTDFEFVQSLGLKIIAGRNFSSQFPTDTMQAALINRSAAASMGYSPEQALGKWVKNLSRDSMRRSIVGVVEDYHFASLKDKIDPLVISPGNDQRVAVVRLKAGNQMRSAITAIGNTYSANAPGYPFEYNFLDEQFNRHYKDDIKQGNILSAFSAIAIFIACLGLFGLASYTAMKRTKEIGVRKVLGSSIQNIVMLLSKDLLKPVLLGTCIAVPAGYVIMSKWLQGFAYRIGVEWWMLVVAAAAAVLIALITVSFQAIKAAVANPVKSLRTE